MKFTRRKFLAAGAGAALAATVMPQAADPAPGPRPSTLDSRSVSDDALEQAAAQSVLDLKSLNAPVIIESIQLLK
jgi:hypothetical protein